MGYLERYRETHRHPVNRALHTVGIPAIVVSLPLFVPAIAGSVHWAIPAGLFVGGWVLQFVGHAFEGKAPAFFSNPMYLIIGPFWWIKKVCGSKSASTDLPPNSPDAGSATSKSAPQP